MNTTLKIDETVVLPVSPVVTEHFLHGRADFRQLRSLHGPCARLRDLDAYSTPSELIHALALTSFYPDAAFHSDVLLTVRFPVLRPEAFTIPLGAQASEEDPSGAEQQAHEVLEIAAANIPPHGHEPSRLILPSPFTGLGLGGQGRSVFPIYLANEHPVSDTAGLFMMRTDGKAQFVDGGIDPTAGWHRR